MVMTAKNLSMSKLNANGEIPYKALRGRNPPTPSVFGERVIFLDPDPGETAEQRKLANKGVDGVVLGYGQMRSLMVMDFNHFKSTNPREIRIFTTRHYRVRKGEFPMAMFRMELAALDVVLYRLFDSEARAGPSDLLDDGTGKCFICDGYVE